MVLLAAKHSKVQAAGDLLLRVLAIQTDLQHRLSRQPGNSLLLRQWKQYERLAAQLVWEHKAALADYLATIRSQLKR
jgi:hypothetical protein